MEIKFKNGVNTQRICSTTRDFISCGVHAATYVTIRIGKNV